MKASPYFTILNSKQSLYLFISEMEPSIGKILSLLSTSKLIFISPFNTINSTYIPSASSSLSLSSALFLLKPITNHLSYSNSYKKNTLDKLWGRLGPISLSIGSFSKSDFSQRYMLYWLIEMIFSFKSKHTASVSPNLSFYSNVLKFTKIVFFFYELLKIRLFEGELLQYIWLNSPLI